MEKYKGFEIGEIVKIPTDTFAVVEYLGGNNIVEVTGFNPEHEIIHWKSYNSIYLPGSTVHSGSHFSEIIKIRE